MTNRDDQPAAGYPPGEAGRRWAPTTGGDSAPVARPVPVAPKIARSPMFCRHCGAPWEPEWTVCQQCADSVPATPARAGRLDDAKRPVGSAIGLYFVLLLAAIACYAVMPDEKWASIAGEAIQTVVVLLWLVHWRSEVWRGLRSLGSWRWYAAAVGMAFGTYGVATVSINALSIFPGIEEIRYSEPLFECGCGIGLVLILCCVQPAVVEELAFRGIVLSALIRPLRLRDAVIVSAFLFMTIHMAVLSYPHLFLIGLLLGFLRVQSGSLYPCMLLHFTHNLLCIGDEMMFG